MKRGLLWESVGNLVAESQTEGIGVLFGRRDKMPFADGKCDECGDCASACPSRAIDISKEWTLDLGKCIFCGECSDACRVGAISFIDSPDYTLKREHLIFRRSEDPERCPDTIDRKKLKVIGRSICIREVDTGSCNACEVEVNSLSNRFYDAERFGITIVASPRHADVLLVTGPLTENMYDALKEAVRVTPDPKVIIAMGSCAISGGMFAEGNTVGNGIADTVDVDMFIPGCPPSPDKLIRAILSAFGNKKVTGLL